MLSFLSLYIYEHPHHHCPFCILKPEYHYLGYALYVPLFAATAAGLGGGAVQAFAGRPSACNRAGLFASACRNCGECVRADRRHRHLIIWQSRLMLLAQA